jgi:YVTN family beta-propeller protein
MYRALSIPCTLGLGLVAACADQTGPTTAAPVPTAEIVDGAHSGGNPHFYWLPPMVPSPSFTGSSDGSLSPVVEICEPAVDGCALPLLAEFTTTSGPGSEVVGFVADGGHYTVNWRTDLFDLDPTKTYRIRVLADGVVFGHADVDIVQNRREVHNVLTGEFVPLVDGRTLPVKFRIEQGALRPPQLSVVATIPVEAFPATVASTSDGSRVFVLNQNPFSSPRGGSISLINTASSTVEPPSIVLGTGVVEQLAVTPDGTTGYLAISNRVEVVDLVGKTVIKSIVPGGFFVDASDIALDPRHNRGYVTDRTGDLVLVIDLGTNELVDTIRVGPGNVAQPYGVGVTHDGSRVYVSNRAASTLSVIETATRSVTTVPLSIGACFATTQLALSSHPARAYATSCTSNALAVVDINPASPTFNLQVDVIPTGGGILLDVHVTPNGRFALVTARDPTNELLLLDVHPASPTYKQTLARVAIDAPGYIAFGGVQNAFGYVTSIREAGVVSVVSLH